MRQFWELLVRGRLCRVTELDNGLFEAAVFDTELQAVDRWTLPAGTTLEVAKAEAARAANAKRITAAIHPPLRVTGTVKWFNPQKGYGFITQPGGTDIFVHFSAILMEGFKELVTDEMVEFELRPAKRGAQAVNVIRPNDPDSDNYREILHQQNDLLAVTTIDGHLRIIRISIDGKWHFVDPLERNHAFLYVNPTAAQAYCAALEELEALIDDPRVKEEALHDFFERYPDFLLTDDYCRAHSKVTLELEDASVLIPDFVLEPVGQGRLCDLLELKLPSARLEVLQSRRKRFTAAVMEACAQLRTYRDFFEEVANRDRFRARYGLDAFRPRLYVIIGRRGEVDPLQWRRIEGDVPALQVRTYDDILDRAKYRLAKLGVLGRPNAGEGAIFLP